MVGAALKPLLASKVGIELDSITYLWGTVLCSRSGATLGTSLGTPLCTPLGTALGTT